MSKENKGQSDLGFIFRKKYGKDPCKLSLHQIDRIVFGTKEPKTSITDTSFVSCRGDIFDTVDLGDPDKVVDEVLATW